MFAIEITILLHSAEPSRLDIIIPKTNFTRGRTYTV